MTTTFDRERDDRTRLAIGAGPALVPTEPGSWLVRVKDGGSRPGSAPGRFVGRRLAAAGGGTSSPLLYTELPGDLVFTCLNGVPAVGESLTVHRVGGYWVGRKRGPGPPPITYWVCVLVRRCDSMVPLSGATVTVTGDGGFSGSCVTGSEGRCCVEVPGPGTYPFTVTHPDYGSGSSTGLAYPSSYGEAGASGNNLICLGGAGGQICLWVAGCGYSPWPFGSGATVQFFQGGSLVAEAPLEGVDNGFGSIAARACACVPDKLETLIRVINIPARFSVTETVVPANLLSGCGGSYTTSLYLEPATGFGCLPCASDTIPTPYPAASTLFATDGLFGNTVTLSLNSGFPFAEMGAPGLFATMIGNYWGGTGSVPVGGCGPDPYGLNPDCPEMNAPVAYLFRNPPPGATPFGLKCLVQSFVKRFRHKWQWGPGENQYTWVWCRGDGLDARWFPGFFGYLDIVSAPPGFVASGSGTHGGEPCACGYGGVICVSTLPHTMTVTE